MTHSVVMMIDLINGAVNKTTNTRKVKRDVGKEASKENKEKLVPYLLYIQRIPHV